MADFNCYNETFCPSPCEKTTTVGSPHVEDLTELCMRAIHMDLLDLELNGTLLSQAKNNAQYFYDKFRKVIPRDSLGN